jgi:hypothetical protein
MRIAVSSELLRYLHLAAPGHHSGSLCEQPDEVERFSQPIHDGLGLIEPREGGIVGCALRLQPRKRQQAPRLTAQNPDVPPQSQRLLDELTRAGLLAPVAEVGRD